MMRAHEHISERLREDLQGLEIITDPTQRTRLSKDFSWFSPVLKEFLEGYTADVVVKPRTETEMAQVAAACVRHGVPLTVRGSGTGNYGQATPLEGGVVMDLSGYNQPVWLAGGAARVQTGIRLADIDKWARPQGWEIRMASSTFRLATAGGFFAGGFGGVGSVTYGPMAERGNVLGCRAMTLEAEPRFEELRGDDALDLHHAYGVNGVVTELEFAMAPRMRWLEALVAFDDFMAAARFGQSLAASAGVVKKLITVLAAPIPELIGLEAKVGTGRPVALVLIAENAREPLEETAAEHGGEVVLLRDEEEAPPHDSLVEHTWNHTTLRALKQNKDITYLQSGFRPGKNLEQVEHLYRHFGDEVMMHLEFLRVDGMTTCSGLQLVRYTTRARLEEIIAYHEGQDVHIANPHTHVLEDGNKKSIDARQLEKKRRFDPHGLLNPGKMRAWGSVYELPEVAS